jgi:hypothetical protein
MKIALSAGHYPEAPGACHDGHCEHEEAAAWCAYMTPHLLRHGIDIFHVPTGPLPDKVAAINRADCDVAVEIHFNACADCGASGAETLFYPGSRSGEEAAWMVQAAMVAQGARNRGVKEGWYKMDRPGIVDYAGDIDGDETPDYFLSATNCPAIIIEPEFIEQWPLIQRRRIGTVAAIAEALAGYLGVA